MNNQYLIKFIEDNNLININSEDEELFTSGKINLGFFIYLIIEIEEHYGIVFKDEELIAENFNTISLINSMLEQKMQ